MKKHPFLRRLLSRLWKKFKHIRLTDRCLLLFMFIVLAQSLFQLLFISSFGDERNMIDVVIRTTAAAIFGYFISAGFLRPDHINQSDTEDNEETKTSAILTTDDSKKNNAPSARIGFVNDSATDTPLQSGQTSIQRKADMLERQRSKQQIIIVTTIGLFSLLCIIIARDSLVLSPGASAAISQLRDFVSASVGLLIGHSARDNI